ncbi:MAG: septum formation initiator family protein [Clostridia bacterium]|jgi:cell division protein FtsB|nr:septum formation initiator family protein [Clostridia bacterium]
MRQTRTTKQTIVGRTKKKWPRYLKVALSVAGLYVVFIFATGGYELWQLQQQMHILEEEQGALLEKQEALTEEIQSLNEPEIIERIARESLGMVKAGETIIVPAVPGENLPKPKDVKPEDMGD